MATILKDQYPGFVDETDPAFPDGKYKNETTPGALDGTPLERVWQNDQLGFFGAILKAANTTANGTPDTPELSQLLNAMINVTYQNFVDYNVGVEAIDGGVRYECIQENGPGKPAGVKPTSDSAYWRTAARAQFDRQWPVGSIYHNGADSRNPNQIFPGGASSSWTPIEGRVLVGAGSTTDSRGENRAFTNGAQGGEFAHAITAAENGPHAHSFSRLDERPEFIGTGVSKTVYAVDPSSAQTDPSGNGAAHNNLQPYRVVYAWQRIA